MIMLSSYAFFSLAEKESYTLLTAKELCGQNEPMQTGASRALLGDLLNALTGHYAALMRLTEPQRSLLGSNLLGREHNGFWGQLSR